MKTETNIDRELREALDTAAHELTIHEGHPLADSPGGDDQVWMDLRRREFGVTATMAHIMADKHVPQDHLNRRPSV